MTANGSQGLPLTVPVAVIADLLDLTPRRVQQLAGEGVLPKESRGEYPLRDCLRAYARYVRDLLDGRGPVGAEDRARKLAAQARMAELDLAEREGKVILVEHFERVLTEVLGGVRAHLLNLPGSVAAELVGVETERRAAEILQEAVNRVLAGLVAKADELEAKADEAAKADPEPGAEGDGR